MRLLQLNVLIEWKTKLLPSLRARERASHHSSKNFLLFALVAGLELGTCVAPAEAAPAASVASKPATKRHAEFQTPEGLRDRVDFWTNIFAKYEKNQVSIHHRAYPQVTFEVLDLRQEAAVMGEIAFEKYRKKRIEDRIKDYQRELKALAAGGEPQNELQQLIADRLSYIKGIRNVYQWTLKEDFVRSQSGIRQKWVEALQRSGRYLPTMERIFVQQYGLPVELTRLPFVESSFDYSAYSSVGAAGIWQFMPRTGKQYRMVVGPVVDERRDPIIATDAAARYLSSAYSSIRTWPLAVTSYNHGVGGVLRRMKEAGTTDIVRLLEHPTDRPFGFASSNFFPSFLAAIETYDARKELFPEVSPLPSLRLAEYRLPRAMSVAHVTKQLGISVDRLKEANYALLDRVWQGRSQIPAGYVLRVPEEYQPRLASLRAPESRVASVAPASSAIYGGVTYKVRKGDTLSSIARHFGVSINQIRELNDLSGTTIRVGQLLQIKQQERAPVKPSSPAQGKRYRVKPGDTLGVIARRNGTTVLKLMAANRLRNTNIKVGQTLIIP
jgi:membrane-bound lytic murein transglycosylase D